MGESPVATARSHDLRPVKREVVDLDAVKKNFGLAADVSAERARRPVDTQLWPGEVKVEGHVGDGILVDPVAAATGDGGQWERLIDRGRHVQGGVVGKADCRRLDFNRVRGAIVSPGQGELADVERLRRTFRKAQLHRQRCGELDPAAVAADIETQLAEGSIPPGRDRGGAGERQVDALQRAEHGRHRCKRGRSKILELNLDGH